MQSVLGTSNLGVSISEYVKDRVMGRSRVPSLAEVIRQKATEFGPRRFLGDCAQHENEHISPDGSNAPSPASATRPSPMRCPARV